MVIAFSSRKPVSCHLYRCECHFLWLHINKQTHFALSYITDVSKVWSNGQTVNLKHNYKTVAQNTHPSPFNDFKR